MVFTMGRCVKVFIACCLFILGGVMNANEKDTAEDYEIYVNEIIKSFAKEMRQELGLVCIGDGGRMPYDVEEIAVKFIAYRRATVEEARALEVFATERLLLLINNHEKIRPYLREYPFGANRTEVGIAFCKPDSSENNDGSVSYVSHIRDNLHYYGRDPKTDNSYDLLKEPYSAARKIAETAPRPKKIDTRYQVEM